MLALTFGITSITMALIVAALANNDRKVIRFFTLFSVLFVNLAFLINHLKDGAHDGGPSAVGLTVVSLGLLAVVVGCVTGYQVAGPKTNAEHNTNNPPRQYAGRLLFWMAATILIPTWSYFYFLGFVPLFDAAVAVGRSGINGLGVLNESRLSRDAYVTGVGQRVPLQGLMEIYRNIGVPVLFALALDQIRLGERKIPRLALIVVCIISVMAAGQRWPLMNLLLASLFVFSARGMRFSGGWWMKLGLWSLLGGVIISALQARTTVKLESFAEAIRFGISNLFERVLLDQVQVPIASYYSSNPELTWNLGATYMKNFSSFLPGSGASYPVEFYQIVTGDSYGYTAPPDIYTEAYINFSWLGVVAVMFLWGFIIASIEVRAFTGNDSWNIALKSGLLTLTVLSSFYGFTLVFSFIFVAVGCVLARTAALLLSKNRDIDPLKNQPSSHLLAGPGASTLG